jgi:serpin B
MGLVHIVIAAVVMLACRITTSHAEQEMIKDIAAQQRMLGLALLKKSPDVVNQVISPFSIHMALTLARMGASGRTADELDNVLLRGMTFSPAVLGSYRELQNAACQSSDSLIVQNASSVWIDKNARLHARYAQQSREFFSATIAEVDFANSEKTRAIINNWVSQQTKRRIPNLIPPGALNPQSVGALVSALYLKAPWANPFLENSTIPASFYSDGKKAITVSMMQSLDSLPWYEDSEWKATHLSYDGGQFSMVFLLPNAKMSSHDLKSAVSDQLLNRVLTETTKQQVIIKIPKFTVRTPMNIREQLTGLGIQRLFSSEAELQGITEKAFLISDALHEGYIEVNEYGTEAAAATALMVAKSAAIDFSPKHFTADHPFLFLVVHQATGAPMFMGVVGQP